MALVSESGVGPERAQSVLQGVLVEAVVGRQEECGGKAKKGDVSKRALAMIGRTAKKAKTAERREKTKEKAAVVSHQAYNYTTHRVSDLHRMDGTRAKPSSKPESAIVPAAAAEKGNR
jgi:hypothetical protein